MYNIIHNYTNNYTTSLHKPIIQCRSLAAWRGTRISPFFAFSGIYVQGIPNATLYTPYYIYLLSLSVFLFLFITLSLFVSIVFLCDSFSCTKGVQRVCLYSLFVLARRLCLWYCLCIHQYNIMCAGFKGFLHDCDSGEQWRYYALRLRVLCDSKKHNK